MKNKPENFPMGEIKAKEGPGIAWKTDETHVVPKNRLLIVRCKLPFDSYLVNR
jgi:hypothetical protein